MLVTGLVGRFGVAALAGYGIGVRLEFMLVPLAFGIGSGLTTLVGVAGRRQRLEARGAGRLDRRPDRRRRASASVGWIVALVPEGWARLFTNDPAGDRRHRRLHHARGAVLLPVRRSA